MNFRVGLTGGIGSGKSEVARIFAELGALVVDADELAREAVAPGSDGLGRIAEIWPAAVRDDGTLDRAALAAIVFADPHARERLNRIVHPIVRALGAQRERSATSAEQLIVHVVPLLFETGFFRECDANVLVVAPLATRLQRVTARDQVDEAAVRERVAAQIDPERARALADEVIENDGDLAELRSRAVAVFDRLRRRAAAAR